MSLAGFHAGLKAQLLADVNLDAWATTHFGRSLTAIDGAVPVAKVQPHELPALVIEMGDAELEPIGVGGDVQGASPEMVMAIVWSEKSPTTAFMQRLTLPELVVGAIMADDSLGGGVDGAWLADWSPDRGANHPTQVMRFTVRADLALYAATLVAKPDDNVYLIDTDSGGRLIDTDSGAYLIDTVEG